MGTFQFYFTFMGNNKFKTKNMKIITRGSIHCLVLLLFKITNGTSAYLLCNKIKISRVRCF
jgi:hypothetical protein